MSKPSVSSRGASAAFVRHKKSLPKPQQIVEAVQSATAQQVADLRTGVRGTVTEIHEFVKGISPAGAAHSEQLSGAERSDPCQFPSLSTCGGCKRAPVQSLDDEDDM